MDRPFRKYILWSLFVQVFLLLLTGIVTDMGETLVAFIYGSVAYWSGVAIILRRKSAVPNRTDVLYLKWGLVVLSLLSVTLSPFIWALRGKW